LELTHLDSEGRARMVDISLKSDTERIAVAQGKITMQKETLELILAGNMPKGDVLAVARVAGIMGAKKTSDVIPMCHPIMMTGCKVYFRANPDEHSIEIQGIAKTTGKTGIELEALTAVSMAALTIYDMCKAVDRGMMISDIRLVHKAGGKSGEFNREGELIWQE
jgi:cyclic pyranopterin phosphate synthase